MPDHQNKAPRALSQAVVTAKNRVFNTRQGCAATVVLALLLLCTLRPLNGVPLRWGTYSVLLTQLKPLDHSKNPANALLAHLRQDSPDPTNPSTGKTPASCVIVAQRHTR